MKIPNQKKSSNKLIIILSGFVGLYCYLPLLENHWDGWARKRCLK